MVGKKKLIEMHYPWQTGTGGHIALHLNLERSNDWPCVLANEYAIFTPLSIRGFTFP